MPGYDFRSDSRSALVEIDAKTGKVRRATKKLPKGTAEMTITPRAEEPEDQLTTPPRKTPRIGADTITDTTRKAKRLNRA